MKLKPYETIAKLIKMVTGLEDRLRLLSHGKCDNQEHFSLTETDQVEARDQSLNQRLPILSNQLD